MRVRLIAKTQGVAEAKTGQELISYVARVSNPNNQNSFDSAPKLIKYLIKNNHWSPFEHAFLTFEIVTSRGIAAQILRHRSFVFQEFCVSGDTQITCQGYQKTKQVSIKDLWRVQQLGTKLPKVRVLDTDSNTFVWSEIQEVFSTGVKPVYRVELSNGKTLTCTDEHKLFGREGFIPLKRLKIGSAVACNGVPAHQNYECLSQAKKEALTNKTGVPGMASHFGVSYHTVRKWLSIHNLCFTKKETGSLRPVWNKGLPKEDQPKFGKSLSEETREKMRISSKSGESSYLFKEGSSKLAPFRLKVWQWQSKYNLFIRRKFFNTCGFCGSAEKLTIDHIKSVSQYPELAFDKENLQLLCDPCHRHKTKEDLKYSTKWSLIESIVPVGTEETFDLEVAHPAHNYVANGIITHNSQRYAQAMNCEMYPARSQDVKNRQNSIDNMSDVDKDWFTLAQKAVWKFSGDMYQEAIDRSIAKEQARFLLPLGTETTLYMTGSARSWIHYIELRGAKATQLEHREIALAIRDIFAEEFPDIRSALDEISGANI